MKIPKNERPRGRSLTRSGLQKLLEELTNHISELDNKKITASRLKTLFLTPENSFHPSERFSQFYSSKYPDVFVSYPWDMCFLSELPHFLEEFEKWIDPLSVGDIIVVSGQRLATVRYIGPTSFGPGEYVGAELDESSGVHDGGVYGQVHTMHNTQ